MRTRKQILNDSKNYELLTLEILLDIRDQLKHPKTRPVSKRSKSKGGKT